MRIDEKRRIYDNVRFDNDRRKRLLKKINPNNPSLWAYIRICNEGEKQ